MRTRFDLLDWLRTGVPLTLLIDLATHDGPDSREILAAERAMTALRPDTRRRTHCA